MNKIYYRHGTMFSGKSLSLISTYHTYKHNNKNVLVLKPSKDTRDKGIIKSRMSNETVKCITFGPYQNIKDIVKEYISKIGMLPNLILIDEIQFCSKSQIEELHHISGYCSVMCYGLKTSYTGELFPAIATLIPIAEDISEIKTTCSMCSKKATHNLLIRNGEAIYTGAFVNVEGSNKNDEYYAVCREHFYKPNYNLLEIKHDKNN